MPPPPRLLLLPSLALGLGLDFGGGGAADDDGVAAGRHALAADGANEEVVGRLVPLLHGLLGGLVVRRGVGGGGHGFWRWGQMGGCGHAFFLDSFFVGGERGGMERREEKRRGGGALAEVEGGLCDVWGDEVKALT